MIEELKKKKKIVFRTTIYGADGIRRSKNFPNKTLAKEWERRALRERDEQQATGLVVNDHMTLAEFSEIWTRDKVSVRLSPSTQTNYGRSLRVHILPVCGGVKLREIRPDHANRLVGNLRQAGHVPKGINMILGVLLTMLNDAVEWQYLARNPLFRFRPVKEPELHFDYWTKAEVQQFMNGSQVDPLAPLFLVVNSNKWFAV